MRDRCHQVKCVWYIACPARRVRSNTGAAAHHCCVCVHSDFLCIRLFLFFSPAGVIMTSGGCAAICCAQPPYDVIMMPAGFLFEVPIISYPSILRTVLYCTPGMATQTKPLYCNDTVNERQRNRSWRESQHTVRLVFDLHR